MATLQEYIQQDYLEQDYLAQDYFGGALVDAAPDPPVPTSIVVTPDDVTGFVGNQFQISATVYDQYGDVYSTTIDYSSSDPLVVSVDNNGLATLTGVGLATISVTSGALSDTINVTVNADPPPVFGGGGNIKILRAGLKTIIIVG